MFILNVLETRFLAEDIDLKTSSFKLNLLVILSFTTKVFV